MTNKNHFRNMVLIPASEFFMGRARKSRFVSPGQTVRVESFHMDIYPVTNEAYGQVITGWRYDSEQRNLPVSGLTFDEISHYCRLVNKRLPSEAEWEKAARGDMDRRVYPWGNDFSNTKCNCKRFMFLLNSKVAPVAVHAAGKSPYGCVDMSGNVWEWTATNIADDKYVLKGGSCTSPSKRHLTIASRLIAHKNYANLNFGFRCCLSA